MSGSSPLLPDREERLDEAAAAYLEAVDLGQRPDRAQWLARFPDLADELGEFIDDQERLQRWTSPVRKAPQDFTARRDPQATLPMLNEAAGESACRLANYELFGEIARGGMGVVYRARQLNPNRVVALKMILAGPYASSAELYRFRMETEAAASLDHPHIMPIYEVGDQEGRPFFSMKLMEGGTLAEHLPRYAGEGRAVASLLIKVARAVHHAHQRGILHRDLKPANILLDAQGEPFVTDFGLCRRVEVDSGMTQSGVIVGTPSYMSPEQAAGRKDLTTATDVYSLGAILYTLLTDRPPFRGNTPLETVRGVLELEPSRPRLLRPQVDRDLETICLKCLDKRPEGRYGAAESQADDLQRCLAGEPIVARRNPLWERAWKRTRRNPAAAALVAVSGLALIFLIAAGLIAQHHRLTVAQHALAKMHRVAKVGQEARDHLARAEMYLRAGDAQTARVHAVQANEQCKADSEFDDIAREAQRLIASAEKVLAQEQARKQATEGYHRFLARRDEVLFYGSQFAGTASSNARAAQAAGAAAFQEVGLGPDGQGTWQVSSWLTDEQRREMRDGCYEMLLVLADASANQGLQQQERALQFAERSLQFGPATNAYYVCRARRMEFLGRRDEAARDRALAAQIKVTTALDHFLRGIDAHNQQDLSAASAEFLKALRIQPKHIWARFLLAACRLFTAPGDAEVDLTEILAERPELYMAYLLRGIAHAKLREPAAAEEDFEQALARTDANEQAAGFRYTTLIIRGNSRALRSEFGAAEDDLLQAVGLKPEAHQAHSQLAEMYERQGRTEEAEVQLQRALAADDLTPSIEARLLLYRARGKHRDPVAALADVRRSLELHPYAEAWMQLAEAQLRQEPAGANDYQAAIEFCDHALMAPPYSAEAYRPSRTHYLRAHALDELGQHVKAAEALERFLAAGGEPSADIFRLLGLIRVKQANYPAAMHFFGEALALEPDNPVTLAERGSVYLAIGALGLALEDFEKALARDAENASAHAGRGLIRAMHRDAAGAEEDVEWARRSRHLTQRIAWMAARTFAITFGHLEARGRLVSIEEGKRKVHYRQRAVELLEQALALTQPEQRANFWQEAVQADVWLPLLNDHPRFRELAQNYAPSQATAKDSH